MFFSRLAKYYSTLVEFLYGKDFYRNQAEIILQKTKEGFEKQLIIGSGDGRFLDFIPFETPLNLTLIESSRQFTHLSQQRAINFKGVKVLNQSAFLPIKLNQKVDLVFFPFMLDLFGPSEVKKLLLFAKKQLSSNGKILVLDFGIPQTKFQKVHYFFLIYLFRFTESISAKKHFSVNQEIFQSERNGEIRKHPFYSIHYWEIEASQMSEV